VFLSNIESLGYIQRQMRDLKMNNGQTVSVLMACFNGEHWIEKAIVSVVDQSHPIDEFVIVDDGSTDNSVDIVRRWADKDKRFKVIRKDNTGLADSLNVGIRACSCDWIARIDVDDLWHQDRLKKQIEVLFKDSNIQFVCGSTIEINGQGQEVKHFKYPTQHKALRNNLLSMKKFPAHSSVIYRKSLVEKLGLYRDCKKISEDHDMWLRISEETELVCCNDSITYVRKHDGPSISAINSGLTQQGDAFTSVCCAYARFLCVEEPINLSDSDFDKFQVEKDKVLNKFHFYEFFLFIKWIKNIFNFDKKIPRDVELKRIFYFAYIYIFRFHYLRRISKKILNINFKD